MDGTSTDRAVDLDSGVLLVLTTTPDVDVARSLAEGVVEQKLAACCTILPKGESVYRWEEKVVRESEVILLLKTTAQRYAALESYLVDHHPYDVPEVLVFEAAGGLPSYLGWVAARLQ